MRPYDGLSAASLLGEPGPTGALSEAAAAGPPFHHTADTHAEQRASIKGVDLLLPHNSPQPLLSLELGGY